MANCLRLLQSRPAAVRFDADHPVRRGLPVVADLAAEDRARVIETTGPERRREVAGPKNAVSGDDLLVAQPRDTAMRTDIEPGPGRSDDHGRRRLDRQIGRERRARQSQRRNGRQQMKSRFHDGPQAPEIRYNLTLFSAARCCGRATSPRKIQLLKFEAKHQGSSLSLEITGRFASPMMRITAGWTSLIRRAVGGRPCRPH